MAGNGGCGRGWGLMRLKPTWVFCKEVWFWAQSLFEMVRASHGGVFFLPGWGGGNHFEEVLRVVGRVSP